jgi:hypothetical protein
MTKPEIIENLLSKNYIKTKQDDYKKDNVRVELLQHNAIITVGSLAKLRPFRILERIDF